MRSKDLLAGLLAAGMLLGAAGCAKAPAASTPAGTPAAQPPAQTAQTTGGAADSYPSKPVTIIINSGAGGAVDLGIRTLIPYLEEQMGVTVTPVNVTGGSGWVGWNQMMTAEPDGYTLVTTNAHTLFSYYNKETSNDKTLDDFNMLCNIVTDKSVIAVRADDERFKDVNDLRDFVDFLHSYDGEILASVGPAGGDDHMFLLKLCKAAEIDNLTPVNAAGGVSEAKSTFYGGHVDVYFGNVGDTYTNYQNGEIKILCVADENRSTFLPDIETTKEQGFEVYSNSARSLAAQPGLDPAVKEKLVACLKAAINDPDYIQQMTDAGYEIDYKDGEAFMDFMKLNEDGVVSILDLLGWA